MPCANRVPAPCSFAGHAPRSESVWENTALRRDLAISVLAPEQNEGAQKEDDGGKQECQPEAHEASVQADASQIRKITHICAV